jgi:hypothetical protein
MQKYNLNMKLKEDCPTGKPRSRWIKPPYRRKEG